MNVPASPRHRQSSRIGNPILCWRALRIRLLPLTASPSTPTMAVGVEGDEVNGNNRIRNARQHKIGFPILDDWRWRGEAGTFMVFTTDQVSGCSTANINHGFAIWVG